MDDDAHSNTSHSEENDVGFRITSDPDRTEIEQPDTHGSKKSADLPFRLLLVSDLIPESRPEDWSAGSYVFRVDTTRFAPLMDEMAPHVTIDVPNTIGEAPDTWELDLTFRTLDAFRPEQVARQIEPTSQLLDVADLVETVGAGRIDLETFRSRLAEIGIDMEWAGELYQKLAGEEADEGRASTSSSPSEEDDESLDRLLGMVDADEDAEEETPSPGPGSPADTGNGSVGSSEFMNALMNAVRRDSAGPDVDTAAVDRLLADLTEVLRTQIGLVIRHPEFRQLEAAWRGLKFLVDRLDFRENVELVVLPAARDDLHEAIHHQVLVPEHSPDHDEPPVSLVIVDHTFGRDHVDIEQLSDLAETGESLQTPVVAGVGPRFFGIETLDELRTLSALRPHLKGDAYAEWEGLREADAAQSLGLALPSFLLRYPYDGETNGDRVPVREDEGLMGTGALAVGVAAANSFADTGWPTHLTDVPIGELPVQSGPHGKSPLSVLLPGSLQSQLARAGFIVLGGRPNRTTLRVEHAPTVRRPGTYDDPEAAAAARAEMSLPCRLFMARAAHRFLTLQNELDPTASLDAIREEVAAAMASFLNVPVPDTPSEEEGDAEVGQQPVSVEEVAEVDLPNQEVVAVRLRPPDSILASNVRLAMALRIPASS